MEYIRLTLKKLKACKNILLSMERNLETRQQQSGFRMLQLCRKLYIICFHDQLLDVHGVMTHLSKTFDRVNFNILIATKSGTQVSYQFQKKFPLCSKNQIQMFLC